MSRSCVQCSPLRLNPQAVKATDNKPGYIDLLCQYHLQRQDGFAAAEDGPDAGNKTQKLPRVTQHCRFRLLNVLFSDALLDRMSEMDATPSRFLQHMDPIDLLELVPYWQTLDFSVPRPPLADEHGHTATLGSPSVSREC